jgi:hypothetical protein
MKNLISVTTIGALLFSIAAFAEEGAGQAKELPGNMVANGGFELTDQASKKPADWNPGNNAAVNSVLEVVKDSTGAHSGTSYLKIQVPAGENAALIFPKEHMILQPGTEYELVVWVRGTGTFRLLVSQYAKSAFVSSVGAASLSEATPQWERYSLSYQLPEEIEDVCVALQSTGEIEYDSLWFGPKK